MKKVLSMVAALLLCVGTQAQIVSSRSAIVKTEKQASSTQWFLRAGLNIMNFSGDGAEGADSNIGYNATFGYQKPLGSTGGYWGMEFGLGSRGFKVDDTKCMAHNIQYSPFTFGWKFAVADNVRIDPHVGVFASYDYTSKMKEDGESISWGDYADYMDDFVQVESQVLNKMFDFIITNQLSPITHWNEININKPVKGMTEDECLLAFGKPQTIQESNGEVQWMYSSSFYLFFKNGHVETIIK